MYSQVPTRTKHSWHCAVPADAQEEGAEGGVEPSSGFKDTSIMMDLLIEDVMEEDFSDPYSVMDIPPPPLDPKLYPFSSAFGKKKKSTGSSIQQNGEMDFMLSPPLIQGKRYDSPLWLCRTHQIIPLRLEKRTEGLKISQQSLPAGFSVACSDQSVYPFLIHILIISVVTFLASCLSTVFASPVQALSIILEIELLSLRNEVPGACGYCL